jgi:hypothetical protein
MSLPDVIIASGTKPGSVTIPEIRDNAQLTFLTAIWAFGDSAHPYFISKNKTFEQAALEAQQLFESHDYTIRMSPKMFITQTLFIDWIEMVFFCANQLSSSEICPSGPRDPSCRLTLDTRHPCGHSVLRSEPHYPRSAGPTQPSHLATTRFMRFRDFQDSL